MADFKDNSGTLKPNRYKKEDRHPDYKGRATVNGVQVYVSAWVNDDTERGETIGLRFEPVEDQPSAAPAAAPPRRMRARAATDDAPAAPERPQRKPEPQVLDPDDDIPF